MNRQLFDRQLTNAEQAIAGVIKLERALEDLKRATWTLSSDLDHAQLRPIYDEADAALVDVQSIRGRIAELYRKVAVGEIE